MGARIIIGDCLEALRAMEPNTIDAVLTDPPYGLSAPPDVAEVLKAWTGQCTLQRRSLSDAVTVAVQRWMGPLRGSTPSVESEVAPARCSTHKRSRLQCSVERFFAYINR